MNTELHYFVFYTCLEFSFKCGKRKYIGPSRKVLEASVQIGLFMFTCGSEE